MEPFLGKKYKLIESSDITAFQNAIGFNILPSEAMLPVQTTIELRLLDDVYVLLFTSPSKTVVQEFQSGVSFTETCRSGEVKITMIVNSNKLQSVINLTKEKIIFVDYIFSELELQIVLKVDTVTATRLYKVIKD